MANVGKRPSTWLAPWFAAAVIAACGPAGPAWADGGAGGGNFDTGGAGGTGFDGNPGSDGSQGTHATGGGGGGAAVSTGGGQGGSGAGPGGGVGGAGGSVLNPAGSNGGDAGLGGYGGGGGGGGGLNGNGAGAATLNNAAPLSGGSGGNGGNPVGAGGAGSSGGGGGGGGYGAIVTGGGASNNSSTITGGAGGAGGPGAGAGSGNGSGGDGGVGVQFTASGASFTNAGSIAGGNGGAAGTGGFVSGTAGAGGAGIVGSGLTVINSGSIAGGANGDGSVQANAITFTGGANTLQLQAGSTITGNIDVTGSLNFSQPTNATLSNVITGTGSVSKSDAGVLTLTGSNTYAGGTTVLGGLVNFAAANNFGSGQITLNGGGLQWATGTTTDISGQLAPLGASGGTFDTNGNNVTLSGSITGGSLAKTGAGTLILTGNNTWTGTTTIAGGTLQVGNGGVTGALGSGAVINDGQLVFNRAADITIASTISGTGSLTQQGHTPTNPTILLLLGNNTYSGSTTIASGSAIQVGAGGTSGSLGTGAVTINGTLTFVRSDDITVNNTLTGSGVLRQAGGTLTLTGASGFTGTVMPIEFGTIAVTSSEGLGTGLIQFERGTVLGKANLTLSNALAVGPPGGIAVGYHGTIAAAAGTTLTLASSSIAPGMGPFSGMTFGSGTNTGTVVLAATGTVGSDSSVSVGSGTLRLGNANSASLFTTSAVAVFADAVLDLNGFNATIGNLQGSGTVSTGNSAGQVLTVAQGQFGGAITGGGGLAKTTSGNLILTGANTYTGGTTIDAGVLMVSGSIGGAISLSPNGTLQFVNNASGGTAQLITNAGGAVDFSRLVSGMTVGSIEGSGSYFLGGSALTVGANNLSTTVSGVISDGGAFGGSGGSLIKLGTGTLTLTGANTYSGGTTINAGTLAVGLDDSLGAASGGLTFGGGTLQLLGSFGTSRSITLNAGGGTIDTNSNNLVVSGTISGTGNLTKNGSGILNFQTAQSYTGGTTINAGTLVLDSVGGSLPVGGALTVNGGIFDMSEIATGQTVGALAGTGGMISLGNNNLTTNSNSNTTLATQITGPAGGGGLIKQGSGILTLTGLNLYSGGTTIQGGLINFASPLNLGSGLITLNGGGLQWATGNTTDISFQLAPLGAGGGLFDTNGSNVTFASGLSGSGGLTKQGNGMLSLNGTNTYTGATIVSGGTLAVNGSLTSTVTVNSGGILGGNGTLGGLVSNGGTLAPGNSIGTLNVTGNFSQIGGVYQVEANAAGQSDRINVGGTATINGAAVQVLAQPGSYGRSTTYTILRANGGVSGTYSGVSSNFAFLTPSLSYDANDVFLTLSMAENAFSFGGRTYNQRQVGRTLDQTFNGANGDYATVLSAIAGLGTANGPQTLDMISGQQYAGFSNAMVQGAQLFMSNFASRAGSRTGGARVALAEACDVACDATTPALWGAWGGAVGGTGTIAGNDNAGTFTYSVGGFSGGLDRRITDNFLAGVTVGYQTGGQWTGGFDGRSVTDTVQAGLYASFAQGPVYVDALAGYAYNANRMWRNINIPGLQPRTAFGQAGANQFLGQLEAGYRVELGGAPGYFVTPFALIQGSTANQNGFTETGAQSLNLNITQQTSGSLRTIFGAQVGAAMDVGLRDKLAAQLRVGWSHEYADTARPVTATFAGAPAVPFTVFGAAPTRDGAVIGFSASTAIAEAMGVYLRYEGTISGQDSSHALTAGLRMTW